MSWVDIVVPLLLSLIGAFTASYFSYRYYKPKLRADLQKEFESRFNEKKWTTYQQFADILYEILDKVASKRIDNEMPKLIQRLRKFISQLWIVGSDEVVNTVSEWFIHGNRQIKEEGSAGVEGLVKLMDIIVAMRKDLGYSDSKLGAVDLLKTFINDLDTHISLEKKI